MFRLVCVSMNYYIFDGFEINKKNKNNDDFYQFNY